MNLFSKLRRTVPFIVSFIVLIWVCSYDLRSTSYQNETWFGILVIFILLLCLLFMYWGMGGLIPDSSNKRKAFVYQCTKMQQSHLNMLSFTQRLTHYAYLPVELWNDDPILEEIKVKTFARKSQNSLDIACVIESERVSEAMSAHLMSLIKKVADAEIDQTDQFCFVVIFLSSSSVKAAKRVVQQCHRYGVAPGSSNMIIACHANVHSGLLHISPPSSVGYTQWRKIKKWICQSLIS